MWQQRHPCAVHERHCSQRLVTSMQRELTTLAATWLQATELLAPTTRARKPHWHWCVACRQDTHWLHYWMTAVALVACAWMCMDGCGLVNLQMERQYDLQMQQLELSTMKLHAMSTRICDQLEEQTQ